MKTTTQTPWPGFQPVLAVFFLGAALSPGFGATSVQFSTDTFLADEHQTPARISLQRSGDTTGTQTVTVTAINGPSAFGEMAKVGEDYLPFAASVMFAAGQTNQEIEITLLDDYFAERDKAVLLQLTNLPVGVTSDRPQATLLIRDDDRPGSVDRTWSSTFGLSQQDLSNAWPSVVARLPDGKAILNVQVMGDVPFCRVVRINRDGSVDPTFHIHDSPIEYQSVFATPDDKLLVVTNSGGVPPASISALRGRLNSDGTWDNSFSAAVTASLGFDVRQAADDKLLVWTFDSLFPVSLNGQLMPRLFQLNNDGTLDSSFVLNAPDWRFPELVMPQTNGQILISVLESAFPRTSKLFRLNSDGSVDPSFQIGRGEQIGSVLTQADGKFVVSGHFPIYNGMPVNSIVQLNEDGSVDGNFQSGAGFLNSGPERVWVELRSLPGGQILALGRFDSYDGTPVTDGAVLNSDGTLDATAFTRESTFVAVPGIDELLEVPALFVYGEFVGVAPSTDNPFDFDQGPFLWLGHGQNRLRTELALRIVSTQRGSDGTTQLLANGLIDRSYTLQASENLANWSDLATQVATTNRIKFTDAPTNSPAVRFFRLKSN